MPRASLHRFSHGLLLAGALGLAGCASARFADAAQRVDRAAVPHQTVSMTAERYELQAESAKASYADVAASLGISVTDVTNYLFVARRELRRIVLSALRDLTANDEEFREEAKALLGIDV